MALFLLFVFEFQFHAIAGNCALQYSEDIHISILSFVMECKYSLFRSVMESADNDSHKEEVGHKAPPPNPKEFHLGRFDKTLPAIENFEGYKLKQGTEGSWRVRLSTMGKLLS